MATEIISPERTESISWDEEKILVSIFANYSSELTTREYRYALREFFSFLGQEVSSPTDLKRHHIIFYKNFLEKKGLYPKAKLRRIAAASSFCKFPAGVGLVDKDLTYGIRRSKTRNKTETSDLSDQEVKRVFADLDPDKYNYQAYRAILAVGLYTGLRSRENRHLRIKNLGEVDGIRIFSLLIKGEKPHEIPLHPFGYNSE